MRRRAIIQASALLETGVRSVCFPASPKQYQAVLQPHLDTFASVLSLWPSEINASTFFRQRLNQVQSRSMAWKSGLDRPPPTQVIVDYDPASVDSFIQLADAIEDTFPGVVVQGNEKNGAFDVGLEEEMIFSQNPLSEDDGLDVSTIDHILQRLRDAGLGRG